MALSRKAAREGEAPDLRETSDVQDVELLGNDIVALCQTSAYDDMTWAEIDRALMYASHLLKVNFGATGTPMPAPPPEPPA